MKYFIANLAVHTIVALVLIIFSVFFSNRNKKGRTKHPVAYFLPIVFCALAVIYTVLFTAPRLRIRALWRMYRYLITPS